MATSEAAISQLYDDRMYDSLVEEYYDASGFLNFGYWDESTRSPAQASENLVERLLAFIPRRQGMILDVACGLGATTRYLLNYYPPRHVTGINISERQLVTCRQALPNCSFVRMNATQLGFADESFDSIISVEAAFHFRSREMFLREAHRVLKSAGSLVLSDALISHANRAKRPHWDRRNLVTSLEGYRAICEGAGFSDVRVVDATEECWRRCFWNVVRFAHAKFLNGEIGLERLDAFLERVYRLAADLEHYILVAAVKGTPCWHSGTGCPSGETPA